MAPLQKKSPRTSSLYKSVTCWSSLIQTSQEAPKEPENPGPQTACPLSLLPHILLSRYNPSYQWPPKLSQGLLQRPPPNQISLSSFPNHLRNPQEEQEDLEDPFLCDLLDLTPQKHKSTPPSSMLFGAASGALEEKDLQMMMTLETKEMTLPTMSPMRQAYRTMSPSPWLKTSNLWDPSQESSMKNEPEQTPFSPST